MALPKSLSTHQTPSEFSSEENLFFFSRSLAPQGHATDNCVCIRLQMGLHAVLFKHVLTQN